MSFAYWKKCDFQLHTPRDPNWNGPRPIGIDEIIEETGEKATEEDVDIARIQWANGFIDQCNTRNLEAIALTDHHEMVMVPYVQRVINERKTNDPNWDLWLFPGMELTAHGGVQCLILFDLDLSEEWRRQAQGKLGIVYASLNEKSAKSPAVNQLTCNYAEIGEVLDELEDLRGRYIVLPNVSQGNNHTVLKDGAHADFLRMLYVGGYLDQGQTINSLSPKNKCRISGDDNKWSVREIYPLPTSDSRTADYSKLGTNNTWIKLAVPTAEAIRQAFLGHQSRIAILKPEIPSLTVSSVEISGITILEPATLAVSPEFNSIIGGRGSGKKFFSRISFIWPWA